jgi:microcystin-dependent protein
LVNGFLAMGTRIENWQQLPGGIDPEEAVAACVELLNEFFEAGMCVDMTPIGSIVMFPINEQPDGWLICDGQAYSRTLYAALFALIGTTYGAGDESTTFNIPDWRDLSPMGAGGSLVGSPGAVQGEAVVTLTTAQMPSHTHAVSDPGHAHRIPKASATVNAGVNTSTPNARTDNPATPTMTTDMAFTGASITATGGSEAHNNLHPVMGVAFLIYAGVI